MTIPSSNPVNKEFVPIYWRGASGTVYDFQIDPIGAVYRAIEGVYIFSRHLGNNHHTSVYVGETDNFWRRLSNELEAHHAFQAIRLHGATHICTLHVSGDRSKRLQIETDLRNALNPPCNKQ